MSNKNQPSVQLTHAGYNVRVVLDRKGMAYPVWPGLLPFARTRESFNDKLRKAARSLGAKGWVRI